MPVKFPKRDRGVYEAPNTFTQKRLRDSRGPERHIDQNPVAKKSDRESVKGDRIYMKPEFKKAITEEDKNFRAKSGGGGW